MNIKCHVYQARNGLIYLSHGDGRVCSALILQQVNDLRLDLYSLDDFSLEDFKKAYSVPQSSQNVPAAVVTADEHLEQAIGAMLETGMIQFEPFSWCYRLVDMTVSSQVFTNKECVITVDEDNWNCGPANCVAKELTQAITSGWLKFVPCTEKTL